jgi:heptosyltransferase-2
MHQERILIRGLNWLGDAVMCLPALTRLREAYPDAHITMFTPRKLADLWAPPLIDSVLVFEKDESLLSVARRLREGRYTTGLVLPMSFRSALELWAAGIPRRVGCDHRGRALLLSHAVQKPAGIAEIKKLSNTEVRRTATLSSSLTAASVPPQSHHIYRYLSLVAALGASAEPVAPNLPVDRDEATETLCRFGVLPSTADSPLFGMAPGGEYGDAKRWPEERFIETACRVHQKTGCRWVLIGAAGEVEACQRISEVVRGRIGEGRIYNLAGRTSLRDLSALFVSCSLVLSNDSGPMHLAAAVGTPVVGLFCSTSAELTGPGLPGDARNRLLSSTAACSPCFLRKCPIDMRCMKSLGVARVVQGIMDLREPVLNR